MTEIIFDFLNKLGFTHPVHPALTHIPMGMAVGAVIFRTASFFSGREFLARTGYHCIILGLLGIPPTVFAGYLDWQYAFGGEWEFLIVLKMVLAAVMAVLLAVIAVTDRPDSPEYDMKTLCYVLILPVAAGLGFSGGELQYG